MKQVFRYLASSVALSLVASNAFALVETEVSAGSRSQKATYDTATEKGKTKTVSGSEVNASLLFDPVPAVPISFGLTFQTSSINTGKVYEDILAEVSASSDPGTLDTSAKGTTTATMYGPMVKVWVPMPFVKPYLKFAYLTGSGTETLDMDVHTSTGVTPVQGFAAKGSQKFTHSGTDIDLGVGFSPVKFFTCFLELGIHKGKNKVKSQNVDVTQTSDGTPTTGTLTTDDLTDDDKAATNADASSIRLGLGLSF